MNKKVVVIGGGHGSATLLRGLKKLKDIDLTAIVAVSDSGGSTGRLRDIFDIPAIGDIRNVMTSLAQEETMFQYLMDYRFEAKDKQEEDVVGHNLGNLILLALLNREEGNLNKAISSMSKVLKVKGQIIPSSLETITLFAEMEDKTIVKGEANIPTQHNQIKHVFFDHDVKANQEALEAIEQADVIILGIGSLFTSILPNLIIHEIAQAVNKNPHKTVYYCNVMSELGETDGYSMEDHVDMLQQHGVEIDSVVYASDTIPQEVLDNYTQHQQTMVKIQEKQHPYQLIYRDLLVFKDKKILHDPQKIASSFWGILEELDDVI